MRSPVRLFCSLLLISTAAFAQSDRGTITGTVADPAGAVVPNASIEAKNLATGLTYQTASTATGNYTVTELPAGPYEINATVPGFKKYVRQGLVVQAAQTYRVDIALEVGANTESVTVSAEAPLLKTESGELSHNLSSESLDTLPILGIGSSFASNSGIRNPYAATNLVPGGIFQGDVTVRINGTPQNTESLRIEGQDSTNATMTAFGSQNQPSVDSIEEFSVQTSNYAAEFGQAGGGVFIATMKSGTNQFHGTAYDYFVNEALNASTPFTNVKPRARRNDYGGTFGGPVLIPKVYDGRNKTFFFYNFEQYRENTIVNNVPLTVPTAAYRTGDFLSAIDGKMLGTAPDQTPILEGEIFDPKTAHAAPNGQIVATPFANNTIPTSRIDPVALNIQNLVPLANLPGLNNNYLSGYTGIRHTDINSIKVDQMLTGKQKISIFYSRTHTYAPYSQVLAGDSLPKEITVGRGNYDWVHTTRLNYDYTIAPTLLLHVGVGYVNQHGPNDYTPAMDSFVPASIGLTGTFATGRFPSITNLCNAVVPAGPSNPVGCGSQGGLVNLGPTTSGGSPANTAGGGIFSFRPTGNSSVTWVRGNHTYKAGVEIIVDNFMYAQDASSSGVFNFSAGETSEPYLAPGTTLSGGTPGFPYASFLLGAVDSGNIGVPTDQHLGQQFYALFVQDSWKITHKITLDYGLRWDYQTYLREGAGRMPSISTEPNPGAGNLPGATIYDGFLPGRCQCNLAKNYPFAFGPRLGLAWQIAPKTVFRAGFGVVYAKPAAYDNLTISSNNPFSSPGLFTPATYLSQGVPVTPNPWPYFNPGQYPNVPGQVATSNIPTVIDPNAGRPPRQLQWSIGLQHEVVRNLLVEADYVGNRGAYWDANNLVNYNALNPQMLLARGINVSNPSDLQLLNLPLSNAAVIARGFTAPYAGFPLSATLAQSLRPFPEYGTIAAQYAPLGDTWYDSLQVKVIKRLSHGFEASYSLAWQKSLTNGAESEGTGGGVVNDVFNRQNSKYISQFDQPLASYITLDYTTPNVSFSGGRTGKALSWVSRDWTIGSLLQYRSGLPIQSPTATSMLATAGPYFQGTFMDRVPGVPLFTQDLNCHCFNPNTTFVLNPAAWMNPPAGQFGTAAAYYNDYRYQRRPTENINFGRTFRMREKMTLNVRAEFTNIFNRTELNNPTSTNALLTQVRTNPANPNSQTTGGFGYINTSTVFSLPRQGTIVARLTF
ncbi:MAG TPA: TonB-dependent receptor [Bryobacteraceae bacterium]|jgi:hypothetical protein